MLGICLFGFVCLFGFFPYSIWFYLTHFIYFTRLLEISMLRNSQNAYLKWVTLTNMLSYAGHLSKHLRSVTSYENSANHLD